jgi:hypothetical protein
MKENFAEALQKVLHHEGGGYAAVGFILVSCNTI